MKKPKFILKVNQNSYAKVYVGGKWHKHVTELEIIATYQNIQVTLTECKLNNKGFPYALDGDVAVQVKKYFFGNKWVRAL